MPVSIVVPTYNEVGNVAELLRRLDAALDGLPAEVVFVDDSSDGTAEEARRAAGDVSLEVRVIHRDQPTGGLGGAVCDGIRAARNDLCVVMDADLQHPPETIPQMLRARERTDADIVVASRYAGGGSASGLADRVRVLVSRAATAVTKAMFPVRLRDCSDPMTGFFLIDRSRVDLDGLRPRGFKILLEILARQSLSIAEVPFDFDDRHAGESKASLRQGARFLVQLAALRFGKMSVFALIGGIGAVANLAIMAALTALGMDYIWAAVIAAETTIIGNFLLIERFVFRDMRDAASTGWVRFAKSFSFNNAEALVRIPLIYVMVESWHVSSVLAAGITLAVAFVVRFVFHSLVVYAPRTSGTPTAAARIVDEIDAEVVRPGEL